MRNWISATAGLCVLFLCGPVFAQSADFPNAAAARAFADKLIADEKVDDQFENITSSPIPVARHRGSGLICTFPGIEQSTLRVYPSDGPRGDDVGCSYNFSNAMTVSMYVNHFPQDVPLDVATQATWDELAKLYPAAEPFTFDGDAPEALPAPYALPEMRVIRFAFDFDGEPVFSRSAVAVVDGWVVTQRVTSRAAYAKAAESLGEAQMIIAMAQMVTGAPLDPLRPFSP